MRRQLRPIADGEPLVLADEIAPKEKPCAGSAKTAKNAAQRLTIVDDLTISL
jgi:hypothetical protein